MVTKLFLNSNSAFRIPVSWSLIFFLGPPRWHLGGTWAEPGLKKVELLEPADAILRSIHPLIPHQGVTFIDIK